MKQIKLLCIIAIACTSLMSFTLSSSVKSAAAFLTTTPKITWEKENYDFGEIQQGKPVSVEFIFSNTSETPLLVSDVATSCGCTASDYSKEPIAPGKSSKIKVTYNAAAVGAFTKSITVNFNDADAKKVLMIKGTVK